MRILYGVVGEGMGHATRSRVVLEHLVKAGHEVRIVVSGRAHDYLKERFAGVHEIWGFTLAYEENEVRKLQTFLQNLSGAVEGWPQNVKTWWELASSFDPEVVISDFESFSYLYAKNRRLPVISVDNMQIINRARHEPAMLHGFEKEFELARTIVKTKLPGAFHYLVTTFFRPPLRKKRTTLVPPLLRPEILAATPTEGDHLLVYQSAAGNDALPRALQAAGVPCRVYGYKRNLTADETDGLVMYRPFSEQGFIEDLRSSRGVVTGGGFTLISEAVKLHKPILSLPIGGQFEQTLNALYLEALGYGRHAPVMEEGTIRDFLPALPRCAEALAGYEQHDNQETLAALDEQLARSAEGHGHVALDDETVA